MLFHVLSKRQTHHEKIIPEMCLPFVIQLLKPLPVTYFASAWETATATATVMPTIGLLPAPRKPIIST